MTQLNLLPDVKIEYLRATRQKRLVIGVSLIVAAVSVALVLLLSMIAFVFQKKNLNDIDKDIQAYTTQLKNTPDLQKVLTVQNQLNSLPPLHQQKPVPSRLFGYLTQLTPVAASISKIEVSFKDNTMIITGLAKSLDVANTFIDTLKFTKYQVAGQTETVGGDSDAKAFNNVVMSEFTRNDSGANYKVSLNFAPEIFDGSADVKLVVPSIISTRSTTEQPADLFQPSQSSQTVPQTQGGNR